MLGMRADWFVSEKVTKAHNTFSHGFAYFFVSLKFQFYHTCNFFMKQEIWRF